MLKQPKVAGEVKAAAELARLNMKHFHFHALGGACTWMLRPRSEASDYFAVCSFRFGAAPAAPAGLAALLKGGIWLMD